MKFLKSSPTWTHRHKHSMTWLELRLIGRQSRRNDGLNQNMFKEDFINIFHLGDRSGKAFEIETNDSDLSDRLLTNIATRRRRHSNEHLMGIVEDTVQSLMWHGRALYYLKDRTEDDGFDLLPFGSENIIRVFRSFVQYVPARIEQNGDGTEHVMERELRLLDKRRILFFSWPASIRRKISAQNRLLRTLDKYDSSVALLFQPQVTHDNPNPRTYFDFVQWRRAHDMAFYRATRNTGWNGRKYDSENRSDFFDCHRLIRFRKMQTSLRDSILQQLSSELTRVGRQYNVSFKLNIFATDEITSTRALNDIENKLKREEIGFKEVIDFCYRRKQTPIL
nr:hypothetical protein [uncultured Shinella sp.]